MPRKNGRQAEQFSFVSEDPIPTETEATYQTIASVWYGEDAELVDLMLSFYPRHAPELILDATVNSGRFWRASKRNVIGLDIDRRHSPTVVGDNTAMPFKSQSFDVVVYDPPHVPNQGKDRRKDFNTRFGLVLEGEREVRVQLLASLPSLCR